MADTGALWGKRGRNAMNEAKMANRDKVANQSVVGGREE
jgi:hypothetical protein